MKDIKILIVEDEIVPHGIAIRSILEKENYTVIGIAGTYEEAISFSLSLKPDIIIMDISLNGDHWAGIKAAAEIKKKIEVNIVYLTGVERSNELVQKAAKTKPFDFLTKPVSENQLLTTMMRASLRKPKNNLLFISYSHEDISIVEEMHKFLNPLKNKGIDSWSDTKIEYGDKWKEEIAKALENAKAAVLLISIDFVSSTFIKEIELPSLLSSAESKGTIIIPVFLRHVPYGILEGIGISQFQGLNSYDDPMINWNKGRRAEEGWGRLYEFLLDKFKST